jgi:hypothetical protein
MKPTILILGRAVSFDTECPMHGCAGLCGPEEVVLVVDDEARLVRFARDVVEATELVQSGRPDNGKALTPLGLFSALVWLIWKQVFKYNCIFI